MPVRPKGTVTTRGVGEAGQGEPVQLPSKPAAQHRHPADRLDFLVDSMKLRERLAERALTETTQRRRSAAAAIDAKGKKGGAAAAAAVLPVDPLPPYTIERPAPGVVRLTVNLPAGGSIGAEARSVNAALSKLIGQYGALLESEGQAATKAAVRELREGTGTDAWSRPVGPNSVAKAFGDPDDDTDDGEDDR